eukprot:m.74717 g.74717  ORF g.74717 m.74717 type:complete len:127 (-) comp12407_c0_seq1:443-823(-)
MSCRPILDLLHTNTLSVGGILSYAQSPVHVAHILSDKIVFPPAQLPSLHNKGIINVKTCAFLGLANCPNVTQQGVQDIVSSLPYLKLLSLPEDVAPETIAFNGTLIKTLPPLTAFILDGETLAVPN